MKKKLSRYQKFALAQLRKLGLILTVIRFDQSWRRGEGYYLDDRVACPDWLRGLLKLCNDEAKEGGHADSHQEA